jgi:hypothetical protein
MCELRSTRVQTDRVLSVPGPQIASILPRPGQVPGTEFLPGSRLLASRRALDRCLAPSSSRTGFQPSQQIASIPPRLGQVPGTGFLDDLAGAPCDLQIASIQPHPWQVPGTEFLPRVPAQSADC